MLGDAARLARHDVGVADRVEQRSLAVVDVAHDGDDRRTRHGVADVAGVPVQAFQDVGLGHALDGVAEILGDELGGVGVENVGERHHASLTHEELDDVDGALRHAVRQLLNGDRLGQHDFTHNFLARVLLAEAFEALGAAAERRDRTRALLVGLRGGAGDGKAAAVARLGASRRTGRRQHRLAARRRRAEAATGACSRPSRRAQAAGAARCRLGGRGGFGRAAGRLSRRRPAPPRSASQRGRPRRGLARQRHLRGGAGSPPARRRRASSSDWRLKLASWARRASSSRLRASAASRSAFSRSSRSRRRAASASWRRRSSSSFARASASARARASRCSSVSVCRMTPVLRGGVTARAAPPPTVGPRGATGAAGAAGLALNGRRWRRGRDDRRCPFRPVNAALLLNDHHLAAAVREALAHRSLFDRALEMKGRLRPEAPRPLSPLLFVSLIRSSSNPGSTMLRFGVRAMSRRPRRRPVDNRRRCFAGPISDQTENLDEECRARRARVEGCMYHICLPQCQIQLARRKEIYSRTLRSRSPKTPLSEPVELLPAVARAVARMNERDELAGADRRLDLHRARHHEPRLVDEREKLERVLFEQPVDLIRKRGIRLGGLRNPLANACLAAARRPSRGRAASKRRGPGACAGCRA